MKVDVRMADEEVFSVATWWAKSPDYVIDALTKQLEAATAIWPELKDYQVAKRRKRKAPTQSP